MQNGLRPSRLGLPQLNHIAHMKSQLYQVAIAASAIAALTSCDDMFAEQNPDAPAANAAAATPSDIQTTADEHALLPPVSPQEVALAFTPGIEHLKFLKLESTDLKSEPKADGNLRVTAKVKLSVTEDIYSRNEAPAEFNEARKIIHELYQTVQRPDASYLLEIGAESELITDEDRQIKALPEAMMKLYNELQDLSMSFCYKEAHKKGAIIEVDLTMDAHWSEGKWNISNIIRTDDVIAPLSFLAPASTLSADAPILTQEFIAERLATIAAKADEFKTAAEEYHKIREEDAHAILTSRRAQKLESDLKQEEENQKASADAAAKKEWSDFCIKHFSPGCKFTGEWTRDERFGELTIQINDATLHENAVQFHGALYDTKLPQASIYITGRCSVTREEDGSSKVNVILYDGQYDPDEPTAEVYDAADGRLILNFDKKGNLKGIMTRSAWMENPKKSFNLHFKPLSAAQGGKNAKK